MKKLLIATITLLLLVAGCAEPTCEELTIDYRAAVDEIDARFADAFDLANNTSRGSLSGPIAELQEINRDAKRLDVPECAENAHEAMLNYQEAVVDGFLAFLSQADDDEVSALFDSAIEHQADWFIEHGRLTVPQE